MSLNLTTKRCLPCEIGTPPLEESQIQSYLTNLKNEWDVEDNKKIKHQFKFNSFKEAISFVNKVADLSESEKHHPDILINYKKVTIELVTHKIGGLSENDFIMASKIELID